MSLIYNTGSHTRNSNKKRCNAKKSARQNKGEDITYLIGMKFDDDDDYDDQKPAVIDSRAKYSKIPEMKTLMDIFTDIPPESIYAVFEENFGDIERTANDLQAQAEFLAAVSSQEKQQQHQQRKAVTPADAHYPRLDSEACKSAPVTPHASSASRPTHPPRSEWGLLQAPPPLASTIPPAANSNGREIKLELTAAGLLNYKELVKKYTFLPEPTLHDIFINTGQSYTMTVLQLWDIYPDYMEAMGSPCPSPPPSPPSPPAFTTAAKIAKKKEGKSSSSPPTLSVPKAKRSGGGGGGGDVLYSIEDFIRPVLEARNAIEGLKRSRNVTIAYKGGIVKTNVPADEFRGKAEELFERGAEEAARIGVEIIVRQKSFVDFHHLTVNETLGVLEYLVDMLKERGYSHRVLMVTGLGKHSSDGRPHLMPAVEQWLSQRRIRYTKKTGSVFVRL